MERNLFKICLCSMTALLSQQCTERSPTLAPGGTIWVYKASLSLLGQWHWQLLGKIILFYYIYSSLLSQIVLVFLLVVEKLWGLSYLLSHINKWLHRINLNKSVKNNPSLKVTFLQCQRMKINLDCKIVFPYWSKFKSWLIFMRWRGNFFLTWRFVNWKEKNWLKIFLKISKCILRNIWKNYEKLFTFLGPQLEIWMKNSKL